MKNTKLIIALTIFLAVIVSVLSLAKGDAKASVYKLTPKNTKTITANELAKWILLNKKDFVILDARSSSLKVKAKKVKKKINLKATIKGSKSCSFCSTGKKLKKSTGKINLSSEDLNRSFVLYTGNAKQQIQIPTSLQKKDNIYVLKGGFEAWKNQILKKVKLKATDSEKTIQQKYKKIAIRNSMLGITNYKVKKVKFKLKKIKKKKSSASSDEGC